MITQWFLTRDGETVAQFTTEEFKRAVAKGRIWPTDHVRRSDSSTFISAAEFLPPHVKPTTGRARVAAGVVAVACVFAILGSAAVKMTPGVVDGMVQNFSRIKTNAPSAAETRRTAIRDQLLADASESNFFRTLSEKDPSVFDTLVIHFADASDGGETTDVVSKARDYLMKTVLEPRAKFLGDDDKLAMMALSRDVSLQLAQNNGKLCIAVGLGKPASDIRMLLTPDLRQREDDLMIKLLDASSNDVDLLPAADLQVLNNKVAVALQAKVGDDLSLLDLEHVPDGKDEAACRVFAAYVDGVLNLPRDESVALVRAMMIEPARLDRGAAPTPSDAAVTAPEEAVATQSPSAQQSGETAPPAPVPSSRSVDTGVKAPPAKEEAPSNSEVPAGPQNPPN